EGRVSPDVQANYLASPPLVVAYALAGSVNRDLTTEPLGMGSDGQPVYLKDIWPTSAEVQDFITRNVTREMFESKYADVFKGDTHWQAVAAPTGQTYGWDEKSTYVQNPPYFQGMSAAPKPVTDITNARILALFGDKITTDHISPAGSIKAASPAGKYLLDNGVTQADFNQYGTRRGNHEVMMRGTFANIRIKNFMNKDGSGNVKEGGNTVHYPSGQNMPIYDASMAYQAEGVPLVVFAGVEYGNGSSRDWAAKGTNLLGVKAVVAQSFERIHRSNLVGMGIVPFTFEDGTSWQSLGLKGDEAVTIRGLASVKPRQMMTLEITSADGAKREVPVLCRIDTLDEIEYFKNGGILHYVLRNLAAA
ncbi:MAG: aconitate hydratase, partial [Hyphomicrobiaceae bacterium]|nr:aconitate hydratase [Hyphomicrobiaceae bacterium]